MSAHWILNISSLQMGENQQRAIKRKIDETESDSKETNAFPRSGVG